MFAYRCIYREGMIEHLRSSEVSNKNDQKSKLIQTVQCYMAILPYIRRQRPSSSKCYLPLINFELTCFYAPNFLANGLSCLRKHKDFYPMPADWQEGMGAAQATRGRKEANSRAGILFPMAADIFFLALST